MLVKSTVQNAYILPYTAISFRKGQLAKVTESLADYLKDLNIYPLKFMSESNRNEFFACRFCANTDAWFFQPIAIYADLISELPACHLHIQAAH
jgi:hypothetical protein